MAEFGVERMSFMLDFERHFKLREEEHTINFVSELSQMLEGKD